MGSYRFLEHTADEKFVVEANSLEDGFSTCVQAFYEIIIPKQKVKNIHTKNITIRAKRLRSLLYDFLNEFVFVFDDEDLLLANVEKLTIKKIGEEYELAATLNGDKYYSYDVVTEIKNMTYSDMKISIADSTVSAQNKESSVKITVVVDI